MKRKLISKTYLKGVKKYTLNLYYNFNDYYLSIKKIIDIDKPFISSENICLIDTNYYIAEVIPKNGNYTMRTFFNENKERLLYYFDITLRNGIDEDSLIPYYEDLYLDVVYFNGNIEILDEDELLDALNNKIISQDNFNLAVKVKDSLIDSIKNDNNKFINLNLEKYLN